MTVSPAEVRELTRRLGGTAAHREDTSYPALAASRFPNPEVRWDPDVVVHCTGVADVIASVTFAAEHGLGVVARSGGVGGDGAPAGSLLLDLRGVDGIWVDPDARSVRVQAGAIWRDVHRELAPFGLAAAGPQFPLLGVGGHVLRGGHGWLSGLMGWASDTVRAVELVTAAGQVVRASEREEPELFWGLRGGGNRLGVVIGLELEVRPLDEVSFGMVWFHPDSADEALAHYRDWISDAPDELTTIVGAEHPPPHWTGPDGLRGRPAVHVLVCHSGGAEQAAADLEPLRRHGGVVADTVTRMPWPTLAMGNDVFLSGVHRRSRMHYVTGLTDDVIAVTERRIRELPPLGMISIHHYGGKLARIGEDDTAMSHRDKPWNYMVSTTWTTMEDGQPLREWQDAYLDEIGERSHDAYYANYLFDEPEHVAKAYNPETWQRLEALAARWDPSRRLAVNRARR